MATGEQADVRQSPAPTDSPRGERAEPLLVRSLLEALASLKLTVVLLSMLIFLVFVGTLAQVHHDVWYVVREGYFRVWFAWVELQTLPTLLGVFQPNEMRVDGGFYFPGGYLIGAAMVVNLLAAHGLRYKMAAKGKRLWIGVGVLTAGLVVTALVVVRALDSAHEAALSAEFSGRLWHVLRGGFAGLALVGAYLLVQAWGRIRRPEWFALAGLNAVLLVAAGYLLLDPDWRINDSGMRIVWQLLQATVAGGLLMASAWLLFAKRSGVMLLHIGIGLLMAHEFYVGMTNVEANMMIEEGETVNFAIDNRDSELAFIDRSDEQVDRVVVVPSKLVEQAAESPEGTPERTIRHSDLPFDVRVIDYFANTDIRRAGDGADNPATMGAGTSIVAEPIDTSSGVGGEIDLPGAYIELLDKQSGESHGTLLVTNYFDPFVTSRIPPMALASMPGIPVESGGEQAVNVGEKQLAVTLRFQRIYKPYEITLLDFSHDKFMGTEVPKNFSSDIRLVDHELGTQLEYKIWMNNPLRYRGETFYQADWNKITGTGTLLQVVKNEGWMLPYVGCAVVLVGMVVHFSITLLRFLDRRSRERQPATNERPANELAKSDSMLPGWIVRPEVMVPLGVGVLAAGFLAAKFRTDEVVARGMPVHEFAKLPVLDEGRVKPVDTVARNLLQFLSNRQEAAVSTDGEQRVPASRWLLDVISGRPGASDYYVFRITNLELLDTLDLPRRSGFYRYSVKDLRDGFAAFDELARNASEVEERQRTPFQRDVMELHQKLGYYALVMDAYSLPRSLSSNPTREDMQADQATLARLQNDKKIRAVVPLEADGKWQTLFEANISGMLARLEGRAGNPAAINLAGVIYAYADGDDEAFGEQLASYREFVDEYEQQLERPENAEFVSDLKTVEQLDSDRVAFEYRFNAASPFYYCSVLYLVAMILSALAWLIWPATLGRTTTAIIVVTLVVHTLALAARMYISGRPPVTNLYTTAVFNGWAIVLAMMVFESIFKLGIGNFVASGVGFTTLLVAHGLGLDEDTFTVMQAVLDTQFWLSTHVITINLGYATTMLAGCLGIMYLIAVHMLGLVRGKKEKQLVGMIYGSLCFAILFSFVGTVLGGLWADDSWGRFWGWDPKENGALMIVLWNAVALHARWGKLVGPRGLAMLAVFGNVITAWSWFGVNQLSQGLHAYAFRDDLAVYLAWFFASQMVILALGAIPWRSGRSPSAASGT